MAIFYKNIPTRHKDGTWGYTTFPVREEFKTFVKDCFKIPGKYGFDENALAFNEQATTFLAQDKVYCTAPTMSTDSQLYWDAEKEKCRKGVIIHGLSGQVWYLPRFYYHWLNFLQIYNKLTKTFEFAGVRDVQYHMALYETLAELFDMDAAVVKKRQIASSYFHIAKLYNKYIFEEGFVSKIFASDKKYINLANGSWKFLNQYHNFTNKYTAWACGNAPDKEFAWQQKVETRTPDGRKVDIGTMATIAGITLDKDPISGVGGACDESFYEEGGIAPTADTTYRYMKAAMEEGAIKTGLFVIAGSVGDLKQCEPLKNFMFNPRANGFYPVETDLIDEHGTIGETALFIPEQWGMPPFIDKYGNSLVDEALDYLNKKFETDKENLSPEAYQLQVSQKPRNLKEAFAMRTVSLFPVRHTSAQIRRIEENEYSYEYVDLERNNKNQIVTVNSDRRPISEFPLPSKTEDKRGVFVIHERPIPNAPVGTYVAIIDPVEVGETKTSLSLASLLIYKMDTEVVEEEEWQDAEVVENTGLENYTKVSGTWDGTMMWDGEQFVKSTKEVKGVVKNTKKGKVVSYLEGGKIVAFWCGRFNDENDTNEFMSMGCELYNARALSENNKPGFINYMRAKKRQKFLITKEEMIFDKDLDMIGRSAQPYGVTMTPKLWNVLLTYAVSSLSEELHVERDAEGTVTNIRYGVEKITDIMLLKEMQIYQKGLNVDRLITYGLLQGLIKSFHAAGRIRKKINKTTEKLEGTEKVSIFKERSRQTFKHIGKSSSTISSGKPHRSAFKNLK